MRPLRSNDVALLTDYASFLSNTIVVGHDAASFDQAASIRAATGIGLVDALHVATAVRNRCQVLLTNDNRLAGLSLIVVEMLL